jgi:hypothetical protein
MQWVADPPKWLRIEDPPTVWDAARRRQDRTLDELGAERAVNGQAQLAGSHGKRRELVNAPKLRRLPEIAVTKCLSGLIQFLGITH